MRNRRGLQTHVAETGAVIITGQLMRHHMTLPDLKLGLNLVPTDGKMCDRHFQRQFGLLVVVGRFSSHQLQHSNCGEPLSVFAHVI